MLRQTIWYIITPSLHSHAGGASLQASQWQKLQPKGENGLKDFGKKQIFQFDIYFSTKNSTKMQLDAKN